MRHFFILTHLGSNLSVWNDILKTNRFLHSEFKYNRFNTYYNSNIRFEQKNGEFKFAKHFDILVFNWQIGFKDALDFSKIVYLKNDTEKAYNNILQSPHVQNNYVKNYLSMRIDFIHQLLKRNPDHYILEDNFDDLQTRLEKLADFLHIPPDFKFVLS